MHILYAVTTCSDQTYRRLFADVAVKPAFQSQKYHRLLIEGLATKATVDVIANPPVNAQVLKQTFVPLSEETEGGAHYRYIPAIRNPVLKSICVGVGTFAQVLVMGGKDTAVIVDGLNRVTALSAMLAAKLRGRECVAIVTDLPDMLSGSRFSKKLANFVIQNCTSYVFLTQAMNDYLNPEGKPYVILEGHSDITMAEKIPSMDQKAKPRICFYAGGVSKQYGLENLVKGFQKANIPNAQLHIYGPGDYVDELKEIARDDMRVIYGGMLLNSEIVDKEMEATLLVNPRPTQEAFVRYSFPSKTMEYMASGTPVLTTVLPGMPKEYYPYVFFIQDETPEGIAQALTKVMTCSDEELFHKGMEGRNFVLSQKNNVVQSEKIINMLECNKRK